MSLLHMNVTGGTQMAKNNLKLNKFNRRNSSLTFGDLERETYSDIK